MKKAFTYFRLQLKRIFHFIPSILVFSLVLCIIAGLALNIIIKKYENSEENKKFTIGVVGDTDDSYLGFGIVTLMEFDVSRFAIDFKNMDEEQAKKELAAGKLSAYVIIPENFIDSASHGNIIPLQYVSSSADTGINSVFKSEILEGIEDILETSQRAIYGLDKAMKELGVGNDISSKTDLLYEHLISLVLDRSEVAVVSEIGYSSSVSFIGYYLCAVILIYFSLWGISCCSHFAKNNNSLSRLLASKNIGSASQIIGEYFSYLIAMLITAFLALFSFTVILSDNITKIPEISSVTQFAVFSLSLIPVIISFSAMQFMFFEMIPDVVPCAVAQFTFVIFSSYIGGLFYPIDFLPEAMRQASRFLPVGAAREYLTDLLLNKVNSKAFILLLIYTALFICVAVLIRKSKIKGRRSVNL